MRTLMTCMAMIGAGLFSSPVFAQSLSFFGEIGAAPVFVSLERAGDRLSGWYLYIRQAKSIRLEGVIDAGGFAMDEFSFENGKKTGSFKGAASEAGWTGTWRSSDGRRLKLSLRQDRDALSDLSGRFRCKTSVSESGYAFVNSLDLRAAKGEVTRLSLSHDATGWNDEQSCSIALSDLKQIRSDSGILLRAKEDDETDTSQSAQHCTLRLLGGGDYIVIQVDGCKGAGDTMFCSARGSWSDLVLNRKTQACKAIE
ncbi:MAG: hypothetical protein ABSE69_07655 [Roseiarcus sp.]